MRTVLLWHSGFPADAAPKSASEPVPPHVDHYDWLLERDDDPGSLLMAFRTLERIDDATHNRFAAVRMVDHRRLYLEFEGAVSGGRGTVRRVAAGRCRVLKETAGRIVVEVQFGGTTRVWDGADSPMGDWTFVARGGTGDRK